MRLTSTAFEHNGTIPERYTQDAEDTSPPLQIRDVPEGTESLALIMDDPDAPDPAAPTLVWVHWVVFDIPADTTEIPEGGPIPGVQGTNQRGARHYQGPAPPTGEHRYYFKLYALDTTLDLPETTGKDELLAAMDGHILAQTELMGRYER